MAYYTDTTDQLISQLRNKETIPTSGAAYSDDVLLEYLDQSLKGYIVPTIESVLEEHFVVTIDTDMPVQPAQYNDGIPLNVYNTLTIPSETTGLRLRDIYVIGQNGAPFNLPRLTPTQAAGQQWGGAWSTGQINMQSAGGFFLQGNEVQIYPYGLASGKTLRMTYQRAPLDLCKVSSSGQVMSVTGNVVQLDNLLEGSDPGGGYEVIRYVNVVQGSAPHDFVKDSTVDRRVYTSYAPLANERVSVVGNILTFNPGKATNISVGDWVNLTGTCVYAQNIPREMYPALVQKAAEMCLHAAGDAKGEQIARNSYGEMIALAIKMISPRVIGKTTKVLPINSPFRASRLGSMGRF